MTTQSHRPGIPRARSKLFGRTDDAATIRSLLDCGDSRIITLTGPGGVGKTRLASRVALRYGWSVVYVRLESVRDPSLVLSAIAARLGVRDGGDQPLLDQLATVLDEQDVLLVLDNFEQVLEGGATIGALVDRCSHLKVLITSRSRLHIQGEQVFRVPPLPVSDGPGCPAVKLFIDRVRISGDPAFLPSESELEDIVAICNRLDGLPLAIELAAARVPTLSLQGLVDRLDTLLPLLGDGPRDAPERLQSLSCAIGWSYDLLSPSQRRMFRWCSVFNGGWTIDALLTTCGRSPADDHEVVAELASLVDQNLVVMHSEPGSRVRYLMLDSIREYATDQLRSAGEEYAARTGHAHTFLTLAREARAMMLFGNRAEHHQAVQVLDRERLNVRTAFDWFAGLGTSEQALEAAASISPFNYLRGNLREDRDCLIAALSLPYDEATEARAFTLVRLSIAYWGTGDADSALSLAREGYELAEALDCAWIKAIAISCQAENTAMRAEHDEALTLGLQAITLFREMGPVYELCWALNGAGFAAGLIGNEPLSRELLAEGNELCRSGGHDLFLGVSWCDQGILAYNRGDLAEAAQQFALSASMLHEQGDSWYIARTVIGMSGVMLERGEIEDAARMLGLGESLSLRVGDSPHAVTARQLSEITRRIRLLIPQKQLASFLAEGREMPLSEAVRLIESFIRSPADLANPGGDQSAQHLQLTRREVQILTLMASKSDKEIATDLSISRRTVTTHVTHIFSKMGVKSRTEAVIVAMRCGLIPNRVA